MLRTLKHAQLAGRADVADQEIAEPAHREPGAMAPPPAGGPTSRRPAKIRWSVSANSSAAMSPAIGASRCWSAGPSHCLSTLKCCGGEGTHQHVDHHLLAVVLQRGALDAGDDRIDPSPLGWR